MADQIGPLGAGSPRRTEPRPAAPSSDSRKGEPHVAAHDGVPEIVDTPVDRQSRRYAHTLRRGGELSGAVRVAEAAASSAIDDAFEAATTTKPKPARPADPSPPPASAAAVAAAAAGVDQANRSSAPSDSTALYRKRTNPTLPAMSPDLIGRATHAPPSPSLDPPSDGLPDLALDGDLSGRHGDDAPPRLPAVVLDAASHGIAVPLTLPRPPMRLILTFLAAALLAVAVWCFHAMF
jgi:hypothetical protein